MRVPETIEAEKKLRRELKKVWESLRPPPRMSLSEWCDAHRLLAREYHPVGGRWTTIPYQREILDTIGDFHTQEIVLCTSAQVGKTSMLENLIAWHVVFDPAPILTVFPETSTLRAFSQDRIDTMVRDMPELNDKFDPKRERDKSNTITYKKFRGGHLTFATAGSARQMRSRPIRILLCDEVDAYDLNVSGEGDPIRLAKVRTANFFNRKIVITSTPTTEETSRVWKAFLESDQRYYYVPCPHCGEMQILTFSEISQHYEEKKTGKIMFEGNAPESTYYECVKGCKIEHYEKHKMLEGGEWRKHNPGHKVAGFFVNSLYSPWIEWKDLVSEFLEVKHDAFQLQVFVNTKLGEIWKERASLDVHDLVSHCSAYDAEIPTGVGVIVCGVDIQINRIELYVWGFGIKEQCWLIDHDIIWKDPGDIEAWKELELALNKTYKNVNGAEVGIHSVAIDTGYLPELVRNFVRSTGRKRVHAVVGINKYGMNVLATKPRKNERDKTLIWPVGTDTAKKMIMARFRIEESGPGYVSFPLNTKMNMRDIFYQLTSERAVVKYSKGKRIYVFEKKTASSRNEALDCFVYALAALYLIGDRVLDKMESYVQQMTDKEIDKKKEKKEKKKKEKPYDLTDELVKSRMQRFKPRRGTWQRGWNI